MEDEMHIFLFGDDTYQIGSELSQIACLSDDPILQSFLDKAFGALRYEIAKLPEAQRKRLPSLPSVSRLLALPEKGRIHIAVRQALTCIYHLASFIRHCSSNKGAYPRASNTFAIGLCTGALAAAAVSCCNNLTELLQVAVYTIRLAFRVGLCATETADSIEQANSITGSWSCVAIGSDYTQIEETLAQFHRKRHLPLISRPYISEVSSYGVSISGPPSILQELESDLASRGYHTRQVDIQAPYHAPHLYDERVIDSTLSLSEDLPGVSTHFPVISSCNGSLRRASTLIQLFRAAVADILINRIDLGLTNERLSFLARLTPNSQIRVHSIGTSAGKALVHNLGEELCSNDRRPENDSHVSPLNSRGLLDPLYSVTNRKTVDGKCKIAILGMSGRFPTADGLSEFWDVLSKGLDVHSTAPPSRWDPETHVDRSGKRKNTSATPYGCWLKNPDLFDPKFFNISPREAPQIDPAQRIALLTAYEAIEQAGIVPERSPSTQKDRVGVFFGVTSNDWMETNSAQDIDTYFIPGGNRAFIPGRINYCFKFSGPSYTVDTACSSSLAAIHTACNSLWQRDVDTAIAGGTNILTNPDFTAGLDRGHFLSRTGNCKTFDDAADGYCRGEGAGTVILKRLDDAIFDNDPILAVICDVATNHSAEAQSITRPCVEAQKEIFRNLLNNTCTDPYDVSYVEMHGTGTQAGDAGEMESVLEILAPSPCSTKGRLDSQSLYLGSAKANIGHGEAAAGVSSLIKALLMMQNNAIPPHCGIKTRINQRFPSDLQDRGVHIAATEIPWPRNRTKTRKVFLNNFSAAGGNSALLLEDAPAQLENTMDDPRTSHLVTVSAKSATALRCNTESLISYLDSYPRDTLSLPALSYTTTARRMHHRHRIVATGSDLSPIQSQLRAALKRGDGCNRARAPPTVLFAFTGQGSFYAGMGEQLTSTFSYFRANIERLDGLAQRHGFTSVLPLIRDSKYQIDEGAIVSAQLAILIFEMALFRLWTSWGIQPNCVVGHSLGQYAALNAAGVISDSDTIYLVGRRAQLLRDSCQSGTHSMLAVRASGQELQPYLRDTGCDIACLNSPKETVISGATHAIRQIRERLGNSSIKTTELNVPFAYHSSQVEPVLAELEHIASGVSFNKPLIPVISPLYGAVITECGKFGAKYLASHFRKPLNMISALDAAQASHLITEDTIALEIGPQPVVCTMVKACMAPQMPTMYVSQRGQDLWPLLTGSLSSLYATGSSINWAEYHRDFIMSHKVVRLPTYNWDLQSYWIGYRNDWSLRKGDPLSDYHESEQKPLESTTIHKVVREEVHDRTGTLVVEADISRPDLSKFVQGHKVNGIPLCTPSVYADIALTAIRYLIDKYCPEQKGKVVDISDMTIIRALVAHGQGPQLLRVSLEADWPLGIISCRFSSTKYRTQTSSEHGHCTLRLKSAAEELALLEAKAACAISSLSRLQHGLLQGKTFRFNRSMIYKMVAAVADFDSNYRAIDDIILDNNALEACGRVSYSSCPDEGLFPTHPAILDALSQIGGFVMNANDSADLDKEVYVNHGWKSFQMFENIQAGRCYQTHVKMEPRPNNLWEGDIMVFEAGRVVACFKGMTLQGVAKRALHFILSREVPTKSDVNLKATDDSIVAPNESPTMPPAEDVTSPAPGGKAVSTYSNEDIEARSNESVTTTRQTHSTIEAPASTNPRKIQSVLNIIAEESGIAVSDLFDDSNFVDMGIDSLLVLILVERFHEELRVDIPTSLLMTGTVKGLKDYLRGHAQANEDILSPVYSTTSTLTPEDSMFELSPMPLAKSLPPTPEYSHFVFNEHEISCRPATSVVLQGDLNNTNKILLLFPDGAGSASSYIHLPRISPDIAVVGVTSPFIKDPSEMTSCDFNHLMAAYMDELRQRQPHGPYYLAGWSSGGILAFRAAQLLIQQGEVIAHLALVDSPAPLSGLDRLPEAWYNHCASKNIFGGLIPSASPQASRAAIERIMAHFRATIEKLHDYHADPLPADCGVNTTIIWAVNAVLERGDIDQLVTDGGDTEGLRFLTDRKDDLGTRGWEKLLPGASIKVEAMSGANHFSMMRGENARVLAGILRRMMG